MGTVFSFDVRHAPTPAVLGGLRGAVALLHRVDRAFSPFRPDSAVSRLARGELHRTDAPPEVRLVLGWCEEAEQRTGGCFSARAAGVLDPCGLVKGWATQRAHALLRAAGAPRSSVNGGGDVCLGAPPRPGTPWRTGVADPRRPGRLLAVVAGHDHAVATSGGAERGAHIIDPRTGRPAAALLAATVTGPDLTWADAYATAAVVMGPEAHAWIGTLPDYALLTVDGDGRVRRSPNFPLAAP
ncbi:thiamine biosynthesis protein [Wenjunlia vitaminophila]|uniref:FAD:protein FMN transferase n=2 Tax=Wenjunlia vitaminophila TaxID=76728 RepID=A0A0T6LPG3_WENVI|nr:thiamine biosynthesis protein [Wenjunlia vitaminophila]